MGTWIAERIAVRSNGVRRVLLFGVTVEIATMAWPSDVHLTAVDRSNAMIRAFWPGRAPGSRALLYADWNAPPLRRAALDCVLGDGIFNTLRYPDGYLELGRAIRELLRPGGCLFVRGFAQLTDPESPERVLSAYREGEIDDYHALRFRFLTSLQASATEGIWATKEYIDDELSARGISLVELYRRTGYEPPPPPPVRPSPTRSRVSYPTLAEFEQVFTPHFRLIGVRHGDHPLAHRCPIFGLQRAD